MTIYQLKSINEDSKITICQFLNKKNIFFSHVAASDAINVSAKENESDALFRQFYCPGCVRYCDQK